MLPPRKRLRTTTFLLIALFSAAIAVGVYGLDAMERLELDTVDQRFDARAEQPEPSDVAVVGIDDETFDVLDLQWPFPRSLHGQVIDRLTRDGAKVIAYDVQFTEPSDDPDEDDALIASVKRSGRVVLVTDATDDDGSTNVFGGDEAVRAARARVGHSGYPQDAKSVIRVVPYRLDGLRSLAVVTAELASGERVTDRRFTEPERSAWIDFAGPPGSVKTVPFSRVLRGQFAPGTFKDRVVVVGAEASTLQDVHPTSTTAADDAMAGPEIQANSIRTVLAGLPLQSAPEWARVLLVVLLSIVVPLLAIMVRFGYALLVAVVLVIAYPLVAKIAFDGGLVLPVAVPLFGLAIATVFATAGHALMTAAERQRTRDLFARFVPEAVVDDVLAQTGDDLRLGGQRREGTVLFCDLRGFTSFAERLEPSRVIEVLNVYLSEMSDAIMEREGTIVAFMGDGIMAVFGAPIARDDHADRALAAAHDMLTVRLPRFNAWLAEHGFDHAFRMGIGLNSGSVMSGNVGSSTRVEYTAIGDTTNTASRIESMTKDEGVQLLVSEATRDALTDAAARGDLSEVARREVRGRSESIGLWTLRAEGQPEG